MSRRKAREIALRVLYQREVGSSDPVVALDQALIDSRLKDDAREFARALVFGTLEQLPAIDRLISAAARNWTTGRMPVIDRNILRLGLYELMYTDTPASVSIDEAVTIAKRFSSGDSGRFINGVLGAYADRSGKGSGESSE